MKLFGLIFTLLLIACAETENGDKPQGAIPEHQLQALEKAMATEQILKDAAKRHTLDE